MSDDAAGRAGFGGCGVLVEISERWMSAYRHSVTAVWGAAAGRGTGDARKGEDRGVSTVVGRRVVGGVELCLEFASSVRWRLCLFGKKSRAIANPHSIHRAGVQLQARSARAFHGFLRSSVDDADLTVLLRLS